MKEVHDRRLQRILAPAASIAATSCSTSSGAILSKVAEISFVIFCSTLLNPTSFPSYFTNIALFIASANNSRFCVSVFSAMNRLVLPSTKFVAPAVNKSGIVAKETRPST